MVEIISFYVFAGLLLFAATMVITMKNPVHSALFLVMTFFNCAALWLMLEAEFLAITLVLVYVGAVMVLFLFVVMMLDINIARMREGFAKYLPIAAAFAVVMAIELILVVGPENFGLEQFAAPARHAADYSNTRELGSVLYTVYLYPFEIAAAILLVAIVAAISLTMRRREGTRHQNITEQVSAKATDRVRVVKMESDTKFDGGDES